MMTRILENSAGVVGATLKNAPDSTTLLLHQGEGHGRMTFHPLFDGLTLAYIFVDAPLWPEADANSALHPLLINYCISGRSELLLDDGSYIYLKEKDFCISAQTAQKEYIFPTGHYEGIKLYLDLPLAAVTNASKPHRKRRQHFRCRLSSARDKSRSLTHIPRASSSACNFDDALFSQRFEQLRGLGFAKAHIGQDIAHGF